MFIALMDGYFVMDLETTWSFNVLCVYFALTANEVPIDHVFVEQWNNPKRTVEMYHDELMPSVPYLPVHHVRQLSTCPDEVHD